MCQENKNYHNVDNCTVVTTAADIDGGGNGALYLCTYIILICVAMAATVIIATTAF